MNIKEIVQTPYLTAPKFTPVKDVIFKEYTQDAFEQRMNEYNSLGDEIAFESDVAKKECLVEKTSKAMQLEDEPFNDIIDMGLEIPDDVVIMHEGKLEACFVAFPSSWNAGEKMGMTLAELHSPIADNEALLRASDGIMSAMCSGKSFERYTWGISSLDGYSNHPLYEKPDFDSLDDLTFRVEHERTVTVIEGSTAVFLIHVDIYPLKEVLKTDFGLIKGSIDSMSSNVLQYKNLEKVKELMNEYILST